MARVIVGKITNKKGSILTLITDPEGSTEPEIYKTLNTLCDRKTKVKLTITSEEGTKTICFNWPKSKEQVKNILAGFNQEYPNFIPGKTASSNTHTFSVAKRKLIIGRFKPKTDDMQRLHYYDNRNYKGVGIKGFSNQYTLGISKK